MALIGGPNKLQITQLSIDNSQWWPVSIAWPCNYWVLYCNVNCNVRSDPNDATTQDSLAANTQFGVDSSVRLNDAHTARYQSGEVLLYIQTTGGAGTVTLRAMK